MSDSKYGEPYILSRVARIGDRVVYQPKLEMCGYDKQKIKEGTQGVVAGFPRYTHWVGRNEAWSANNDHTSGKEGKPGLYEVHGGNIIVLWDDGQAGEISPHDLYCLDQACLESRKMDQTYIQAFEKKIYKQDLPLLPYYEGDIVRLSEPGYLGEGTEVQIQAIDYGDLQEKCNDGYNWMSIYRIAPVGETGPTSSVNDITRTLPRDDRVHIVRLVKRGLYWQWENDRKNIKFNSIEEEARFYHSLGLAVQQKNPNTGNYRWSVQDVIDAVKEGRIVQPMFHPWTSTFAHSPAVYNFPSLPEFEARYRAKFDIAALEKAYAEGQFVR